MEKMFESVTTGALKLANRFVFPPIKLAYGNPDGTVTDRQLDFYRRIAKNGPGLVILEPVSVTSEGKEHPRQLCVHLKGAKKELAKITDVVHGQGRAVCLHLNHTGAVQNIPEIPGLEDQNTLTSLAYFSGETAVKGSRVLVIGAGRAGLEAAEDLGRRGYEVVATKRTDPLGSGMEAITLKLAMKRIEKMKNVTLMPHTTVKAFAPDRVEMEQDGARIVLPPFDTVILASGTLSAPGPDERIRSRVPRVEIIGDAGEVGDIYRATRAGYRLALEY